MIKSWFKMKCNVLILKSEGWYFECRFNLSFVTNQFLNAVAQQRWEVKG